MQLIVYQLHFSGAGLPSAILLGGKLKEKALLFASLIIRIAFGDPDGGETKRKSLLFASLIKGLCFSFAFASKLATLRKTKPFQLSLKRLFLLSGWQDSNLRPSGPKPDALTGLRYTPLCPPKPWRRRAFSTLTMKGGLKVTQK